MLSLLENNNDFEVIMDNTEKDLLLLQAKLDTHIEEFNKHREEEELRWDHLITITEQNTICVRELTESTRGVVEAWQAADGTVKTFSAFGRFMRWLSSLGILGAGILWLWNHFGR